MSEHKLSGEIRTVTSDTFNSLVLQGEGLVGETDQVDDQNDEGHLRGESQPEPGSAFHGPSTAPGVGERLRLR